MIEDTDMTESQEPIVVTSRALFLQNGVLLTIYLTAADEVQSAELSIPYGAASLEPVYDRGSILKLSAVELLLITGFLRASLIKQGTEIENWSLAADQMRNPQS